jgi:hypothetical protein
MRLLTERNTSLFLFEKRIHSYAAREALWSSPRSPYGIGSRSLTMRRRLHSWTDTLVRFGLTRKRQKNRAKNGFARPLRVEGLETRRMLAITLSGSLQANSTIEGVGNDPKYAPLSTNDVHPVVSSTKGGAGVTLHNQASALALADDTNSTSAQLLLTSIGTYNQPPQISVGADTRNSTASPLQVQSTSVSPGLSEGFINLAINITADVNAQNARGYVNPTVTVSASGGGNTYSISVSGQKDHDDYDETDIGGWNVTITGFSSTQDEFFIPETANGVSVGRSIAVAGHSFSTTSSISYSASLHSGFSGDFESASFNLGVWALATAPGVTPGPPAPPPPDPAPGGNGGPGGAPGDGPGGGPLPPDMDGDGDQDDDDFMVIVGGDRDGDGDFDEDDLAAEAGPSHYPLMVSTADDELDDYGANPQGYEFPDLSLREALALASDANHPGRDSIVFYPWVDEIVLSNELTVTSDVHIAGVGSDRLTINGNDATRVFNIASGADVAISGLTISGGSLSGADNGAAISSQGNLSLRNLKITENTTAYLHGAAVHQTGGSLQVLRTEIFNNSGNATGIRIENAASLAVSDSTIAQNFGYYFGGLYVLNTDAAIVNSTISGNIGSSVGGIFLVSTTGAHSAAIANSTIANNASTSTRSVVGGLQQAATGSSSLSVVLHNSIVAGNVDFNSPADVLGAFSATSSHNLIGAIDNSTGLSNGTSITGTAASPQSSGLATLANYGGPTRTHALLEGSLAIDKASTTKATDYGLLKDQRGKNRSVDMSVPNGADGYTDMGAYEAGNDYTLVVTISEDESNSGYEADDLSLREALELAAPVADRATITFASDVTNILVGDQLVIANDLTIAGPGADVLTLDGGNQDRVFFVEGTVFDATISGLTITGGNAWYDDAPSGQGGGICNEGILTLDAVAIDDNYAYVHGGGIYTAIGNSGAGLTVRNSTISNNSAGYGGGGIYISGSGSHGVQIVNSTISTNSANYSGSGITDNSGYAQIVNCTVTLNSSSYSTGAGITGGGGTWLANTVVAGNTNSTGASDLSGIFSSTSRHNFIGYDSNQSNGINNDGTGEGNRNQVGEAASGPIDAKLSALADWGGPTKTHKPLYDPLDPSPLLEKGDNEVAELFGLVFDQRGFNRFTYGIVEIGAVELE